MTVMEYIPYGIKFSRLIRCEYVSDEIIHSVILQTLIGIIMAQDNSQLVHYDLHSNNILL
eukprot:Pgem_evm1s18041